MQDYVPFIQTDQQDPIQDKKHKLNSYYGMKNIAQTLPDDQLQKIGFKVFEDYTTDLESRSKWEEQIRKSVDFAAMVAKDKFWADAKVANVMFPLISQASIKFAARAYPAIVKGSDVVKCQVVGEDPQGFKADRAKRVSQHMSNQLLNEMPDWEESLDQLLVTLPVVGCMFKKTYYDSLLKTNVSELVFPDDLVVHYYAKSLESARRVTHKIELSKNDIVERIRSGVFLDIDLDSFGTPDGSVENDSPYDDLDAPYLFLEQHRYLDLDEDGYEEPYIVTIHKETENVVRIANRFELDDVEFNAKEEIVRITPTHYFTKYTFLPAVDGSIYGSGWGQLLFGLNETINTTINQLLDAGTANNRQSGFLGRGIKIGKRRGAPGSLKIKFGEWIQTEMLGDDIKKNIFPLPTKEPSPTLFNLLTFMVETGKDLAAMADILSGEHPQGNVPVGTTIALIEQGLKIYSGIYKRIHRSLKQEFAKIRRLNKLYLPDSQYSMVLDSPKAIGRQDYEDADFDIVPISDPNNSSDTVQMMKAQALLALMGQGFNDDEIRRRYLESLQVPDVEALLPEEGSQQPNPMLELEIQEKQAQIEKIATETALINEKIVTERVEQGVKQAGVALDQDKLRIEAERANIDKADALLRIESASKEDKEPPKKAKEPEKGSDLKGKSSEKAEQGPYIEKGMKSNNEK